jgi:hypothetical protein
MPTRVDPAELPTDWWTTPDVLRYLEAVGAPIQRGTWSAYLARGQAPAPERRIGNYPLWRPATIKAWQASRQGPGRPRTS